VAVPARVADAAASTPATRTSGGGHSHTLDLLRGLSALGVVALHLDDFAGAMGYSIPLHQVGELGVQMFFVLSGYFIGTAVLAPRSFDSVDYGVNRTLRIVPNYLLSLLLVVLLIDATPLLSRDGWADLLSHVFFVQGWFIDYRVSISPVLWTLSVEWMFYLFMLAAAGLIRHRRYGWWMGVGMIVFAVVYRAVIWTQAQDNLIMLNFGYKQLPGTLDLFGFGLVIALLLRREDVRRWASRSAVKLVGFLLAVAAMLAVIALYRANARPGEYYGNAEIMIFFPLLFAIPAAALIMFFQQYERGVGPFLDRSRLAFIGVISYSIYLYHTIVINAFRRGVTASGDEGWIYVALAVVGVFVVSIAMYFIVERPFMERRGRVRRWVHARLASRRDRRLEAAT
jgi:peptidoglycan/LPS O-acetylase OafA/YrhL